jgi:carboxypeptidase Taq
MPASPITPDQAYTWLRENSLETSRLGSVAALLHWDQRTYIPPKGHAHRNEQIALLAKLIHERSVDPKRGEALARLESAAPYGAPLSPETVNAREWRRDYDRVVKIPQDLAVALAKGAAEAETAWEKARPANDWTGFAPYLERLLDLRREEAEAIGYENEPYDALLDGYEPGETAQRLEPIFSRLAQAIAELLQRIAGSGRKPDSALLRQRFPVDAQRRFAMDVVCALGYDKQAGRLDVSAHPFSTTIGPGDSRITTRFNPDFFSDAFFSAVHEAGHGMYEQGLLPEHWGTPMGDAVSLGIHESQSRLWENFVARSRGFWTFFLPRAARLFPCLANADLDAFHFAINEANPGLIRVDADELTYNLHILLRFELELALLRGQLPVADLPEAWNEKMRAYLGVTPPTVGDGALQDVHWSAGLFGYFPTYTLGNCYAAQIFETAENELRNHGGLEEQFAAGVFTPLRNWLREKVHVHGRSHAPRKLIQNISGRDLDPECLIRYLQRKFGELYKI